jgi:drug/metabolite transporter (DMT)-like permease
MIWALLLGYWVFGEVPGVLVLVGAAIVIASGLFVIWRERQLGLRRRAPEDPTTPT